VHGYAVVDSKCQVLLCITWDLGELDKEFLTDASKGLRPTSALHPLVLRAIATAGLIRHALTVGETFALIMM
jgi:hypothetical protein